MVKKRFLLGAIGILLMGLMACTYGGGNMKVNVLNPAAPLYEEGMDAYNSGDYQRAVTAFSDVVRYYPNNGMADEATFMLAQSYEKMGDYLDALRYYKLFVSRYPNHKWAEEANKRIEALRKIVEEGQDGGSGSGQSK